MPEGNSAANGMCDRNLRISGEYNKKVEENKEWYDLHLL